MKYFKKYKINLDMFSKYLFVFSLCILMFGYGIATNRYQLFPYYILENGYSQLKTLFTEEKLHFLRSIRYNEIGVKIHNQDKIMTGVTLLTSFWPETEWTAGIRLINLKGNTLHHWEVKPNDIWPESPHVDFTKNTKKYYCKSHSRYTFIS